MKLRLVSQQMSGLMFWSPWLKPVFEPYFELVLDPGLDLKPGDCYYTNQWDNTAQTLHQQGHKVVFDNLWEGPCHLSLDCYVLQHPAWFWWFESLWYRDRGYHTFQPQPQWTHHVLMPMRRRKPTRDFLVNLLESDLHRFIWSYQERGRSLPRDPGPEWQHQRHFDPGWYNATAMSLVSETLCGNGIVTTPLVSEKTFKPIAFSHPFVVAGEAGTLKYLHQLGFETFENLFDESYDSMRKWQKRTQAVVNTALAYEPRAWDQLTQEKLQHNTARFYDQTLVIDRIQKEVLEPLVNYAQT